LLLHVLCGLLGYRKLNRVFFFNLFSPFFFLGGGGGCGYCRLFSCGTSKEGDSFIVEWNESEGAVKRTYQGFRKRSLGVVQFDTTKNRFLAAGDDFSIKFWDMDNIQLLTTVDADGGLPVSSLKRFFKRKNKWK
jgi:WD40 repeat protein